MQRVQWNPHNPPPKNNTERARGRKRQGLAIVQAFPLAILRLNRRRQVSHQMSEHTHQRADTHRQRPRRLHNCIRCFGEAGSACLSNELWEGGRVTARCWAFDPLPAGAGADLEFGTCKSCSAQRVQQCSAHKRFLFCQQIRNNSTPPPFFGGGEHTM